MFQIEFLNNGDDLASTGVEWPWWHVALSKAYKAQIKIKRKQR